MSAQQTTSPQKSRLEDSFSMNDNQRKSLEDAFFLQEDRKLVENLRAMRAMAETKEALRRISGIKNEAILQKLVDLNVRPETLASLCLIPLVEVAWADGFVDEKEARALLLAADAMEKKQENINHELIKQWLTHKPSPHLLVAWSHYIQGLCEQLSEEEKQILKSEILNQAYAIADASGGFLGLGLGSRISKAESDMLDDLELAFAADRS
ncbi:MAG: hypothetical protein PHC61_06110 [Chitinivibrionales bacterium]|nr:hypothetical protein [Chitinivibrionales bacterium]